MGVRPPSNGDSEEPDSIEFGIAAIDAHLRNGDLSFPASRDEVSAALGGKRIPYDVHGNDVELDEILSEVDRSEFASRQELLNALHPQFEEYRKRHSGGVVAQFRSLLPF